jgi:hypothetical protein
MAVRDCDVSGMHILRDHHCLGDPASKDVLVKSAEFMRMTLHKRHQYPPRAGLESAHPAVVTLSTDHFYFSRAGVALVDAVHGHAVSYTGTRLAPGHLAASMRSTCCARKQLSQPKWKDMFTRRATP